MAVRQQPRVDLANFKFEFYRNIFELFLFGKVVPYQHPVQNLDASVLVAVLVQPGAVVVHLLSVYIITRVISLHIMWGLTLNPYKEVLRLLVPDADPPPALPLPSLFAVGGGGGHSAEPDKTPFLKKQSVPIPEIQIKSNNLTHL